MKDIRLRLFAQEIEERDNTDRAYGWKLEIHVNMGTRLLFKITKRIRTAVYYVLSWEKDTQCNAYFVEESESGDRGTKGCDNERGEGNKEENSTEEIGDDDSVQSIGKSLNYNPWQKWRGGVHITKCHTLNWTAPTCRALTESSPITTHKITLDTLPRTSHCHQVHEIFHWEKWTFPMAWKLHHLQTPFPSSIDFKWW